MDCTEPEFWDQRYRAGRTPWDCGGAPGALADFLGRAGRGGKVLIPGCGSGHEIKAFSEAGWSPTAVDFSAAAVERARGILGPLASCVRLADFFSADLGGPYDLVYERTFLCSFPPALWNDYACRVADLLKPGGILAGLFVYGHEPEPPPFLLADAGQASALFKAFEPGEDSPVPPGQSLPLYAGRERWQTWRKEAK